MTEKLHLVQIHQYTEKALREGAMNLLERIYESPLLKNFRGKKGINITVNKHQYGDTNKYKIAENEQKFARTYSYAQYLEQQGLAIITILGLNTFDVTTTKDKITLDIYLTE